MEEQEVVTEGADESAEMDEEDVATDELGTAELDTDESEAIDWEAQVTEWGGKDTVSEAIALQNALRTRDGVQSLAYQALNALGIGNDAIDALFGTADNTDKGPSIEDLLADPDRILTAAEVKMLLDQEREATQAKSREAMAAERVVATINTTLNDLGVVSEDDRTIVIALADRILGDVTDASPEAIAASLRKANDQFNAKVKASAETLVKAKHDKAAQLPKPLPNAGGAAGAADPSEPKTLDEAKKLARKHLGLV